MSVTDDGAGTMTEFTKVTDEQWRDRLTPEQYHVTREAGTERPFTGVYNDVFDPGTYKCVCCKTELFASGSKFDHGCGWPSFDEVINEAAVTLIEDSSHGMRRIEARCAACDAHLGHLFPDGPTPTGQRFCINSAAIELAAADD